MDFSGTTPLIKLFVILSNKTNLVEPGLEARLSFNGTFGKKKIVEAAKEA